MVQDRGWNRRNVDGGLSSSGRLASRQGRKKSANVATLTGYRSQVQGVSTMARAKQVSKRNRRKIALPAWGAAGMSLAMAGGASAGVAPAADTSAKRTALPSTVTLGEEELSDVSLSKFFVYDREATASSRLGVQYAQRCGGRGGGGAGRCGGGAGRCGGGCAARGCAGRCGGGCAAGRCRCGVGVGCAVVRRCAGCGVAFCAGCSCGCCLSWGACQIC